MVCDIDMISQNKLTTTIFIENKKVSLLYFVKDLFVVVTNPLRTHFKNNHGPLYNFYFSEHSP